MALKHEESQQPINTPLSQTRRSALKKMLVGTGVAAGAAALPDKWTKPLVDRVLVPAHAQTSQEARMYNLEFEEEVDPEEISAGPMGERKELYKQWICVTVMGSVAEIKAIGFGQAHEYSGTIDPAPGTGAMTETGVGDCCASDSNPGNATIHEITDDYLILTIGPYDKIKVPRVDDCTEPPALLSCCPPA